MNPAYNTFFHHEKDDEFVKSLLPKSVVPWGAYKKLDFLLQDDMNGLSGNQ
jgi:hypothetical protein